MGTIGYTKGFLYCYVVEESKDSSLYFLFLEALVVAGISLLLFSTVLAKLIIALCNKSNLILPLSPDDDLTAAESEATGEDINEHAAGPVEDTVNVLPYLGYPLLFLVVNTVNLVSVVALGLQRKYTYQKRQELLYAWGSCIFQAFYNEFSDRYPDEYFDIEKRNEYAFAVCGSEPNIGLSHPLLVINFITIFATSIYLFIIFFNKDLCLASLTFQQLSSKSSSNSSSGSKSDSQVSSFVAVRIDANSYSYSSHEISRSYYTTFSARGGAMIDYDKPTDISITSKRIMSKSVKELPCIVDEVVTFDQDNFII